MKLSLKTPFGLLATLNLVLLPLHISVVVRDYYFKYPTTLILIHWMNVGLAVFLFGVSLYIYLKDIEFKPGDYFYKGRRLEITEGDNMFLNLIRKPYAFIPQIILLLINIVAILEIFGLK